MNPPPLFEPEFQSRRPANRRRGKLGGDWGAFSVERGFPFLFGLLWRADIASSPEVGLAFRRAQVVAEAGVFGWMLVFAYQ